MIVNKRRGSEEKKKEEAFIFFVSVPLSSFLLLLFLAILIDFLFRQDQAWLFGMGCLFSFFFRPSASADIVEPPRQVYSWWEGWFSLSLYLSRSIACIDSSSHFPGKEKTAKRSRKKTSFSINSRTRPSIVCQAQSMGNNSSVSSHRSSLPHSNFRPFSVQNCDVSVRQWSSTSFLMSTSARRIVRSTFLIIPAKSRLMIARTVASSLVLFAAGRWQCSAIPLQQTPISSIFIRDSTNCVLATICQQFRTRDCRDMHVYLTCASQPIIESSHNIKFGCLTVNYKQLLGTIDDDRAHLSRETCFHSRTIQCFGH